VFSAWSELRFAARRLRRAPGFAWTVVLVLALGVGATTAAFGLVNAILVEPLPFPESERLVRLTHDVRDGGVASVDQSDASVQLYQTASRAFEGVAAWRFADGILSPSEPEQAAIRVHGARVTSSFFDVLAVRPALGRGFAAGEDRPGANHVVVLSYRLWQSRFHADPNALGRQVAVNDVPRTIVGIMPRGFGYPERHVEMWLPLARDPSDGRSFDLVGIARLKPAVSRAFAQADLARVLRAGPADAGPPDMTPRVQSLRDSIVGPVAEPLWLLFGSVLVVLLVACTNAAGLFLVRAERMQVELAVRGALGSGLAGVLALTLSEAALLCGVAGVAGMALAALAVAAARSWGAALSLPRLEELAVDARVLWFALGTALLCGIVVSLVPLLRARRAALAQVLRLGSVGLTGGRPRATTRHALVVSQIALSVVLVAASGLLTRSFLRLSAVEPGFDPARVVTLNVMLPFARYPSASRPAFFEALVREAKAIPGVRGVALADRIPLSGSHRDMSLEVGPGGSPAKHAVAWADAAYFETLRIPLLRGRTFGPKVADHLPEEVVVSQAFAAGYWGGASPLGRQVRAAGGAWHTVVGVVGDVHYDALDRPPSPIVYFPMAEPGSTWLVARTDASDGETLAALRGVVHALDLAVPTSDEGSLRRLVDEAAARARALAGLLGATSAVTLLLAAVGLYGVMAYTVAIRRRELGVRAALGAGPRELGRIVSLVGLRLTGVGIAVGLAAASVSSRLLGGLLYGVSPTDLATLGATPVLVLLVALAGTWIPARNAAALDPSESLRGQ